MKTNKNLPKSEYKTDITSGKRIAADLHPRSPLEDSHPQASLAHPHNWQQLAPPLLDWYAQNARSLPWRETKDPYRIWVSEIMLQQTRVEAVKGYYAHFMNELPDVAALASCPEDRLLKLWEGLGYYSRARNLKKAAKQIMDSYDGKLPADHAALLKLPGIGPYTAGAIASIAFSLPVPAVDGNVLRVRARVFGDDGDIAEQSVKKTAEEELRAFMLTYFTCKQTQMNPGAFNQALMDLGATVCLPNGTPDCNACPWQSMCIAYQEERTIELPVKKKKAPRRIEKRTVFLIMDGDRVVLRKRPAKGLLAGLYELPNVTGHLDEKEALTYVRSLSESSDVSKGIGTASDRFADNASVQNSTENTGLQPLRIQKLEPAKHIFTHIEWHMTGYLIRVDSLTSESSGLLFAEQEDVKERYSIPSAFDAYIGHIKGSSIL
ncbi:MAG: A/G-specific adenine glycosylase [Eubacterium sp.]|nr:A/G-specific adenine glycosylase [Eubacterium sp.]